MPENKLQSLTEIFNEKFFRIPDFQRGYSWGKNQLNDFWDDIINLKNDKIHYTGLLTVENISKESIKNIERWSDDLWLFERGMNAYYLIDGQQRLTTSIIMINQILEKFDDHETINFRKKEYWQNKFLFQDYQDNYKSYMFGYERDNPSDEFFKTKILNQQSSTSDKFPEQTLYTMNLREAKDFFDKKIFGLNNSELEEIFKKIISKFKFNFYEIDNDLDIYVTFETMNNRGKPLSNLELLKNRLIYLSTLLNVDHDTQLRLRKDINETWKTIYEFLGKNKDLRMDDDDFLRNHWIMYFRYDRNESESYAKFLLNDKFTAKNITHQKIDLKDIKAYIDSLSKAVKSWFFLHNPQFSNYSEETKEWLQKLGRLSMSAFPPLLMAAMIKCEENQILTLLKAAERFIFLVFRLTQRPSNTKNSHFYRLANNFYFDVNGTNINSVINDINWQSQGESGNGEDYIYYGWFDLEKFQTYIDDQYKKGQGYYSWNGLRYFLYEYELHLQQKAKGNQKLTWIDFNKRRKEDTIEHIYPQTANHTCWISDFNMYDRKQREILLHSLGNLVLLCQSKNSELQNKCFDFKQKHKNKESNEVGFFNGSYSEIEVSSYNKWTPNEIKARGYNMLDFLEKRWNIEFEEWNNVSKDSLLQLTFIEGQ